MNPDEHLPTRDEIAALFERVANDHELAALLVRVANEHPEIHLHCPRGHFIKAVQIGALGPMLWIYPAIGRRHEVMRAIRPGQRPYPEREDNSFTQDGGPLGTITLSCKRCPSWKLTRDAHRLAAELAVSALAGQQKYWL
jgi:hypothetical protein